MYSASAVDSAILFCFLDDHETVIFPTIDKSWRCSFSQLCHWPSFYMVFSIMSTPTFIFSSTWVV
jgi:hypothetical protein